LNHRLGKLKLESLFYQEANPFRRMMIGAIEIKHMYVHIVKEFI